MIISNFDQLATTSLRKQALLVAEAGLEAVATDVFVKANMGYNSKTDTLHIKGRSYKLKPYRKVVVVGFGKVAVKAVAEIEQILGDRIDSGLVIDIVPGHFQKIISRVGTHPLPTIVNVSATKEMAKILEDCTEQDLVICVVSGGGSSLLTWPANMPSEQERDITKALMKAGATIRELNTVRKHISLVKGGQLAKIAYPAKVLSLIFSDVPGNELGLVASGPTVKDNSTMYDAMAIMDKYQVLKYCNIESCGFVETPKDDIYFENVENILFYSSEDALKAMQTKAYDLGFNVKVWSRGYEGEAKFIGTNILNATKRKECLIAVGESTVTVTGKGGVGGRNQELALATVLEMPQDALLLAMASDGRDNSDTAGSLVDFQTRQRAELRVDEVKQALRDHNSYQITQDLQAAVITGNTGSNISDFIISIKE